MLEEKCGEQRSVWMLTISMQVIFIDLDLLCITSNSYRLTKNGVHIPDAKHGQIRQPRLAPPRLMLTEPPKALSDLQNWNRSARLRFLENGRRHGHVFLSGLARKEIAAERIHSFRLTF